MSTTPKMGMFVLNARNTSQQKKMVLWKFPPWATSVTPSLSSTRTIVVRNSTRTLSSRPFSQLSQLSRLIISLTRRPSKMKKKKKDKPDGNTVEDDEDVNALLGMFGALKE
jgi:hypothetical protein